MRRFVILFCFIFLSFSSGIKKAEFYSFLKSNDKKSIEVGIKFIANKPHSHIKNAYLGALIMKSAPNSKLSERLKIFKRGKLLLEYAIQQEPLNTEFRFLRFVIQENSPKFLGYSANLNEDKQLIIEKYNTLEVIVKNEINAYCTESALLSIEDLK